MGIDVLIIGAGPVGLTLANLLGQRGICTCVLERKVEIYDYPRAVGADELALRVWQACGLIDDLMPDFSPIGPQDCGFVFRSEHGRTIFDWRPETNTYGFPRGVTLVQAHLEERLGAELERYPQVDLRRGHEVQDISVTVGQITVTGRDRDGNRFEHNSRFLVGCDGGGSLTRRAIEATMIGKPRAEQWLIVDTLRKSQEHRDGDIVVHCHRARPAVCIPRRGGHERWEFLRHPGEFDHELPDPAAIRSFITAYGGAGDGKILRSVVHRYRTSVTSAFSKGPIFLAGDAAHSTPPFAGQGLACGTGDAFALAWRLDLLLQGTGGSELAGSYQTERREAALKAIRLSQRVGWVVAPRTRIARAMTWALVDAVGRVGPLRRYIRRSPLRALVRYRKGLFDRANPVAGHFLPQPVLHKKDGRQVRLDDVMGRSFALVFVGGSKPSDLDAETASFWKSLGASSTVVTWRDEPDESEGWQDTHGVLKRWLKTNRPQILALRPDRVIVAAGASRAFSAATHRFRASLVHGSPCIN